MSNNNLSEKMIVTLQALRVAGTLGLSLCNLPCEKGTWSAIQKRGLLTRVDERFDPRCFISAEGVIALVKLGYLHAVDLEQVRTDIVEVLIEGGQYLHEGWGHDKHTLFRAVNWDVMLPWKAAQSLHAWANDDAHGWYGDWNDPRRVVFRNLARAIDCIVEEAYGRPDTYKATSFMACARKVVDDYLVAKAKKEAAAAATAAQ